VSEPTDRHQPRHVDRRDQGMRRQRLVTQGAAGGATALALLFGWVFAQPAPAPAADPPAKKPATKAPATKKPAAKAPVKETGDDEAELKAPEEAPVEEPPQQEEEAAPPPDTQSGGS